MTEQLLKLQQRPTRTPLTPAGRDVTCSAACTVLQDTTAEQRAEWRQLGLQLLAQVTRAHLSVCCGTVVQPCWVMGHRHCPTTGSQTPDD